MSWLVPTFILLAAAGGAWTLTLHRRKPVSRLVRALRKRFDGVAIDRQDGILQLVIEGRTIRVPLRRVETALALGESRFEAELAHTLAEVDRATRWTSLTEWGDLEALDDIVPVPLPEERTEVTGANARFTVPIGSGVEIGFVVHGPSSGRWVTVRDRDEHDLSTKDLLRSSLANLRTRTDGVVILQEDHAGREVYIVRQGDGLDSSRLLLRELWDRVAEVCGGELVICAPTRDRVYAAPLTQPESIDRMVHHISEDWTNRPHGVSPKIWVWEEGKLAPWSTHS